MGDLSAEAEGAVNTEPEPEPHEQQQNRLQGCRSPVGGDTAALEVWTMFFQDSRLSTLRLETWRSTRLLPQCMEVPISASAKLKAWASSYGPAWRSNLRYWGYLIEMLRLSIISPGVILHYIRTQISSVFKAYLSADLDAYKDSGGINSGNFAPLLESRMLRRLTEAIGSQKPESEIRDSRMLEVETARPLCDLVIDFASLFSQHTPLTGPAAEFAVRLGLYLSTFIQGMSLTGLLTCHEDDGGPPLKLRNQFGVAIPPFVNLLSMANSDLAQGLTLLQRQAGLFEKSTEAANDGISSDLEAMAFGENVQDITPVPSKAGTYAYLNALLITRPLVDNGRLISSLNTRYSEDMAALVPDLILSTFALLTNFLRLPHCSQAATLTRAFICHRLPSILEAYVPVLFPPFSIPESIISSLSKIQLPSNESPGQASDSSSSLALVEEVKREFLSNCIRYGIILPSAASNILGDIPAQSSPKSLKRNRPDFVSRITSSQSGAEDLVADLDKPTGNAPEIAGAIVEAIQALCSSRDTSSLKNVCNALSKKPEALDTILMFHDSTVIARPLCDILDHWEAHEEQTEYHPIYEEFGSIFLLILVLQHRYDLQQEDLGVTWANSFVLQYLRVGSSARYDGLGTEEKKAFKEWIAGLFSDDAIPNELMSSYNPKVFYKLVPTILDQSILACETLGVPLEKIKGGFEYLLELFLLPSLISAFHWFASQFWETNKLSTHLDFQVPILSALVKPPKLPAESSQLHKTVLSMVSQRLSAALEHVGGLQPRRKDIGPLLDQLKGSGRQRSCISTPSEQWIKRTQSVQNGALEAVRQYVRELLRQAAPASDDLLGVRHNHAVILLALQLRTPRRVLDAILDEITHASADEDDSIHLAPVVESAIDLAAAIISAPFAQTRSLEAVRSLSIALGHAADGAHELAKTSPVRAEAIIRLHRRVQAHLTHQRADVVDVVPVADAETVIMGLQNASADQGVLQDISMAMDDTAAPVATDVDGGPPHAAPDQQNEMGLGIDGMGDIDMNDLPDLEMGDGTGLDDDLSRIMDNADLDDLMAEF